MLTAGIFDIPSLHPLGRFHRETARRAGVLPLFWAGSGLEVCFTGPELHLILEADFEQAEPWIAVEVDGAPLIRMPLVRGLNEVCVFRNASPCRPRTVRLLKETQPVAEDPRHRLWVRGLRWKDGEFVPVPLEKYRLEFVGDSLTSGEGVVGAQEEEAWIPAVFSASRTWAVQTAALLHASCRLVSQSGWGVCSGWDNDPCHNLPDIYEKICAPASGEADRALGAQEPYPFADWKPDAVLINLGTNDANAMRNPPAPGGFRQTDTPEGLQRFENAALEFLRRLHRCNPDAKLVWAYGMCGDKLRPQLERAVERFRAEFGTQTACYLPLPAADIMGSRQHPGPLCHRAAAEAAAEVLKNIL